MASSSGSGRSSCWRSASSRSGSCTAPSSWRPRSDFVGFLASPIIFAGAAHLALVQLVDEGARWTVAVLTALVINLRHVMYSGTMAPVLAEFPRRWRIPLAHLMAD